MPMTFLQSPAFKVVPATSTLILFVDTRSMSQLFVTLTVATAALTNFTVKAKSVPSLLTAVTLFSVSADYTVPKGVLIGTSGDLTVAPAGQSWLILDVHGMSSVEFWATSAGTAVLQLDVGAQ